MNGTFDLFGSGFMEGATTLTTGGTVFDDVYTNLSTDDVFGTRNSTYRLTLPHAVEGPITVNTAGGLFTFGGPTFGRPSFVDLVDIETSAITGTPANVDQAATHVGELLTLIGHGFTSSTVVQFDGVDENGGVGVISRSGTVANNGTRLTVVVPLQAATGTVRLVGDDQTQTRCRSSPCCVQSAAT